MRSHSPAPQAWPPEDAPMMARRARHTAAYPINHQPPSQAAPTATRASEPLAYVRPVPLVRVLALLCYSIPLGPSLWMLWRERRSHFLRFHAAQALVLFALIAAGQSAIWFIVLLAGGMVHSTLLAAALAVVVVALFATLGLGALLLWLRLAGDCLDGRTRILPFAGRWAGRLERLTARRFRR